MAEFVTVAQAIGHLRLDFAEDDSPPDPELSVLELKLDASEAIVLDYLKVTDDSPAWEPTPAQEPLVQAAILLVLSALWEDRSGTGDGDYIRPGGAVANLLARMRDPAIA